MATVTGLRVLGNTTASTTPSNLRLLYKTMVIPAITYGSQLWFDLKKPNKQLIKKLKQVQYQALIQIAGAFWDSPREALELLTYIPPITTMLHKLYQSSALWMPRLPISSKITQRLPADYVPKEATISQQIIPPKHIPFARPCANETHSPLTQLSATFDPHTERAKPFHSQNAPHHFQLSSFPFRDQLKIEPQACGKKERRSLIAEQRIWITTREGRNTLVVITDRSKTPKAAGWAVTGIHAG